MSKDLTYMLKKIAFFDIIILFISTGIGINFRFRNYLIFAILGFGIAFLNVVINVVSTEIALLKFKSSYKSISIICFMFRIAAVCIIALILFKYNKNSIFAYMLGYSLHFISLILYGLDLKDG
ncbi:hypothetical protein ACYUJ6_15705 [Clostridium sp. JNZ X4-2]